MAATGPSSKIGTLVINADNVEVDQTDTKLYTEGTHDYNAHLHLCDVGKAVVDQSGSTIHAKGGKGETTVVNTFQDSDEVTVNQDGTLCISEASGDTKYTAVNYVEGVKDYKQTMKNSVVIVDGTKRKGKPGGGITAHTIVGKGTNATITFENTTTIIRG